jgi:GH35 family endo-1,4-beta-xylanase
MGVMRFQVRPRDMLDGRPEVYRAYVSGLDARVYPTRVEVDGDTIVCRRQSSDSGRLNIAWPVPGFGRPVVATSSLVEREEVYLLPLELARGKISQVRDQVGAWQIAGMAIPEELVPVHREAHQLFARAAASQQDVDQAAALAQEALVKACVAAELLTLSYTTQRLAVRRRTAAGILLGCNPGPIVPEGELDERFCETFNAAAVPINWKQIEPNEGEYHWELNDAQVEWCRQNRLFLAGGPLLDFSPDGLPGWLWNWENDFFNLQSFVCDFVETAVSRYIGRIRHWEVAARANTGGGLALSEEHRLMLVARALEIARQVDNEIQLTIRIDQPWGDYQARGQHQLSPLQFVDALVRSGVGLSAVNLEIAVGYRPCGSASRDLLEFSRLIDLWSMLGIPLHVTLACPSSAEPDPQSNSDLEVDPSQWKSDWSEAAQAAWIHEHVPLLMAKQSVVGIFWSHFSDALPHDFPHAGLLRADETPKPALGPMAASRLVSETDEGPP